MAEIRLSIYSDGYTGGMQLCIEEEDGGGYRIFGPKMMGQSERLRSHVLDSRDADVIRSYLAKIDSEGLGETGSAEPGYIGGGR